MGLRRRAARWARTIVAFVVTLAAAGAVMFVAIASQGHVDADLSAPLTVAPAGGAVSVAEAAALLSIASDEVNFSELVFPDRHRRRQALFQEGAAGAVSYFVEAVARRRAADPDLRRAGELLFAPTAELPVDRERALAEARDALRRYNARAGAIERNVVTLAALARAAAADCAAHDDALRAAAIRGRFGPADRGAEAAFFRARGAAFAWSRLFAAYARDLPPEVGARFAAPAAAAQHPLRAAAEFEPRVLFNAPRSGVAPSHIERLATDMAAASAAARRLADGAQP